MPDSQLVYFQVPHKRGAHCRPSSVIRSAVLARGAAVRVLVGALAQYDECEDECDPDSQVPVRYRGRVMAAPLHAIRPVL
ncbi:hypothetical protein [Nocardia brasiliensis]|uniref:hypothetical protein n=1 Tax=Nocardia brasiliensis TaxID=37326 RepID=UPI002458DF01|nr:hypothetical protein [Nocardia brasiliensis]